MTNIPVITIDGPGGTGKGTISHLLAAELGWHYLDSGALYRVLALAALRTAIDLTDETALEALAQTLPIEFTHTEADGVQILLQGEAISAQIRTEAIGNAASQLAILPSVRTALIERQRDFKRTPGLVADGRDMGTIIFPDATLKIFLSASIAERARRRHQQLKKQGIDVSLRDLCDELTARDSRDQSRAVAPLVPAADAIIIDTTILSIAEVLAQVRTHAQRVGLSHN